MFLQHFQSAQCYPFKNVVHNLKICIIYFSANVYYCLGDTDFLVGYIALIYVIYISLHRSDVISSNRSKFIVSYVSTEEFIIAGTGTKTKTFLIMNQLDLHSDLTCYMYSNLTYILSLLTISMDPKVNIWKRNQIDRKGKL